MGGDVDVNVVFFLGSLKVLFIFGVRIEVCYFKISYLFY